jgi:hypothetical protein
MSLSSQPLIRSWGIIPQLTRQVKSPGALIRTNRYRPRIHADLVSGAWLFERLGVNWRNRRSRGNLWTLAGEA